MDFVLYMGVGDKRTLLLSCRRMVTPRIEIFWGCLTCLKMGLVGIVGVARLRLSMFVVMFVMLAWELDFTPFYILVELT